MDSKLNVNDFPTSNGISKIPTDLLTKMIKIYNDIFAPGWTVASLWELFSPGRAEKFLKK